MNIGGPAKMSGKKKKLSRGKKESSMNAGISIHVIIYS